MVTLQFRDSSVQFTAAQCQQLLSLLNSQISIAAKPNVATDDSSPSSPIGTMLSILSKHSDSRSTSWILDSGATCHITCSLTNFTPSHVVDNSFVTLPNHHRVAVHSIGSITLNDSLILSNVLYIPSFHVNLISVSALLHSLPVFVIFHTKIFFYTVSQQLEGDWKR